MLRSEKERSLLRIKMKILSLFDGMACGMIAMTLAGVNVERYVAYEIDKYAVKTATHNFPIIEEKGDVFKADFTEYKGFDWLVGGSPCTYWSIAQTKNRETTASGMGWELFSQYVRALKEAQPKYFIYENNKSMSSAIRQSITEAFGFEPICINSALVSAQNRQRLYWVGIRQADGTYKKCDVEQPQDKGILLKDILETSSTTWLNKAHTIDATYYKGGTLQSDKLHQNASRLMAAEPIRIPAYGNGEKSRSVEASYPSHAGCGEGSLETRLFSPNPSKQQVDLVAEPLIVKEATQKGYTEIEGGQCVDMSMINSKTRRGRKMEDKSNCLQTSCEFYQYCGTVKAPIYEVKNGMITVKGKQYPIKLVDGYYIIRKLTVRECMRLQTVPEWYEFPVSASQSYKMLGNGWTCEVIKHLILSALADTEEAAEEKEQMDIFDFIGE